MPKGRKRMGQVWSRDLFSIGPRNTRFASDTPLGKVMTNFNNVSRILDIAISITPMGSERPPFRFEFSSTLLLCPFQLVIIRIHTNTFFLLLLFKLIYFIALFSIIYSC